MNWFSRLLHKFDHPCNECGEVRIAFWKARCGFCDPGEGKLGDEVEVPKGSA